MTTPTSTTALPGGLANQEQMSAEVQASLQSLLQTILTKMLGSQVVDKNGNPVSSMCYMVMPVGIPLDPADYVGAWTPGGTATVASSGQSGSSATGSPAAGSPAGAGGGTPTSAPVVNPGYTQAANVSALVDTMLAVTKNGQYLASESQFQVSQAYEAIVAKAQGVPAPAPPANIQAEIDAARHLLWVFDANGNNTGQQTSLYSLYEQLSATWGGAVAAYAAAEAESQASPAQAEAWPVTSKALQVAVQNAWNDWRSAQADEVENALDVLGSVGGAIGPHLVSEGRQLLQEWDLGLTGAVPAGTYYSYVLPSSFADPNDRQNGFASTTASSASWSSAGQSAAQSAAGTWFQNHSSSTSAGGGGMIFGVTFGAQGGTSSTSSSSGGASESSSFQSFSAQMSNVSISFSYGLCQIYRPWLLSELFAADGWYLPNEPKATVSTGNIDDQVGATDQHLLPMLPSSFLVLRDVTITASNWGTAFDQLVEATRHNEQSGQTNSANVSGAVGFLGIGATAGHSSASQSGQQSGAQSSYNAFKATGGSARGALSLPGCQIVGWIGEIVPVSPKLDAPAASSTSGAQSSSTVQSSGTSTPAA